MISGLRCAHSLQEMEEHELWGEADQPAPDVGEGVPDRLLPPCISCTARTGILVCVSNLQPHYAYAKCILTVGIIVTLHQSKPFLLSSPARLPHTAEIVQSFVSCPLFVMT